MRLLRTLQAMWAERISLDFYQIMTDYNSVQNIALPSASTVLLLDLHRLWILKGSYNISGSLNIAHDGWQPLQK